MNFLNSINNPLNKNSINIGGFPEDPSLNNLLITRYGENSFDISFNYTNIFKVNIHTEGNVINDISKNAYFQFPLTVPNLNPGRSYNLSIDSYNKKIFNNKTLPVTTSYNNNPVYTLSKIYTITPTVTSNTVSMALSGSDLSYILITRPSVADISFNRVNLLTNGNYDSISGIFNGVASIVDLSAGKAYSFGIIPYNYSGFPGVSKPLNIVTLSKFNSVGIKAIGDTSVDISLNASDLNYITVSSTTAGYGAVRTFTKSTIIQYGSFNNNIVQGNIFISGLSSGTRYDFSLCPFNMNDMSGTIIDLSATTVAATGLLTSIPSGSVGLYATKWVNSNYTGPIMKLRANTDTGATTMQDFYINSSGTSIGTLINGTGTNLATWLISKSATIAYVHSWNDQSPTSSTASGNNMTQTNIPNQPTIVITSNIPNVYFNGTTYLFKNTNILNATGNVAHTVSVRLADASSLRQINTLFSLGTVVGLDNAIITGIFNNFQSVYGMYYEFNGDYMSVSTGASISNNTTYTFDYNQSTKNCYFNKSSTPTSQANNKLLLPSGSSSYIGYNFGDQGRNIVGSIGYVSVFNRALTTTERNIIESIF